MWQAPDRIPKAFSSCWAIIGTTPTTRTCGGSRNARPVRCRPAGGKRNRAGFAGRAFAILAVRAHQDASLERVRMTPYQLLAIVGAIAVVRIALSLRPVVAGSNGKSTSFAREFLDPFIIAGIAAWILITFVRARTTFPRARCCRPAMHDVLLVDKFEYRFRPPAEGDIVVFPPPIPHRTISSNASSAAPATSCASRKASSTSTTSRSKKRTRAAAGLRPQGRELRHLRALRRGGTGWCR